MNKTTRILCIDIEGGYGGSSRSLFEFIRYIHKENVNIEVWCKKDGPIIERYNEINVLCKVKKLIPKVSSLPRISRNIYVYILAILDIYKSKTFLNNIAEDIDENYDLVHLNHESLFLFAWWLRRKSAIPLVMHIRTNLINTIFSRWQTMMISKLIDKQVFITDNEKNNFIILGGKPQGEVIFNIASLMNPETKGHPDIPKDKKFKIASLSNYSWQRGTDRLIIIAKVLKKKGKSKFLFVVAGDYKLKGSLPGALGNLANKRGTLKDYAEQEGVGDMFLFLGHVTNPESVLKACDVLIKPTREYNPWGRDIIEALINRKPVFSVGSDSTFVKTGGTGFLQEEFDAIEMGQQLINYAEDPDMCKQNGEAGNDLINTLCNGPDNSSALLNLWISVL